MLFQQVLGFASETAEPVEGDILGVLGVDVKLLLLQSAAFLVLVFILGKFVYPIFIKAIDARQEAMEAGVKASQKAQKQAEESEKKVSEELKKARKQADEILVATQKEAAAILADSEEKAARRAENIVKEARADMDNQLVAAREALKAETRALVASATEQIISVKLDASKDAKLVDEALKKAGDKA